MDENNSWHEDHKLQIAYCRDNKKQAEMLYFYCSPSKEKTVKSR